MIRYTGKEQCSPEKPKGSIDAQKIDATIEVLIKTRIALRDVQMKIPFEDEAHQDLNEILGSIDWSYTNLSALKVK